MALAEQISRVRSNIGDSVNEYVEEFIGDGMTMLYSLKYRNIQEVVVTVSGEAVSPDLVYAGAGQVALSFAPVVDSRVMFSYGYSAFTDSVLGSLVDEAGDPEGATVLALRDLLASAARRSDYSQGQTKVNASQVFSHLKDLLTMYSPGGSLSSQGGLTVGNRRPQSRETRQPREDLSRSDNFDFSDNNVG